MSGVTGSNLQLRSVENYDTDNEQSSFVSEVTARSIGGTNYVQVDTDNLEGDYIVTDGTNDVKFEVAVQTLNTTWDSNTVSQDDSETLVFDSGRGDYLAEISADGLDVDDLESIFGDDVVASNPDDDSVYVSAGTDTEIDADFSEDIDAGSYEFNIEVTDTTASDSATIEVTEKDTEVSFGQSVYTQNVGDVSEFSVNMDDTDEAYVFVGGEDVNYLEAVHLVDDDEDGMVNFTFNTYATATASAGPTDAFEVLGDDEMGDDGVVRFSSNPADTANNYNPDIDAQLDTPVEEGNYDLRTSSSLDYEELPDDDEDNVVDEQDVATLELTERNTSSVQTWVAPRGSAGEYDDIDELLDDVSQSNTIAEGDRLVIQVEASGLSGVIDEDDLSTLVTYSGGEAEFSSEDIRLLIEQADPAANADADQVVLSSSNAQIYQDEQEYPDMFFVVVDTRSSSIADSLEDDDDYNVEFQVGDEDENVANFPYLDDDEEEVVSTTFTNEEEEADLSLNEDDQYEVAVSSNATVESTTNLAPGTEVNVRLRNSEGSAFLLTRTVDVTDDQTIVANFDTSEFEIGTEFDVTIRRGSGELVSEDGIFVEEVEETTTTSEPTETTTSEPTETTTSEPTETTTTATTTAEPTEETTTESSTPGFGVVVALVALVAAALLAVRRDN
ncbi:PGF-CTERM sorting domain-containing protein [Haloferax sp. Atlit-6N]|nr:PGF-CTERM sorting domain-containing protein [Haloferax sp. Atlit-6N]